VVSPFKHGPAKGSGRGKGVGGPAKGAGVGGPAKGRWRDLKVEHAPAIKAAIGPEEWEKLLDEKRGRSGLYLNRLDHLAFHAENEMTQIHALDRLLDRTRGKVQQNVGVAGVANAPPVRIDVTQLSPEERIVLRAAMLKLKGDGG